MMNEIAIIHQIAEVYPKAKLADKVKNQNSVLAYYGATREEGVFMGSQVCLTNAHMPRSITLDGYLT